LGIKVSKCFLLNYNLAESRILPDLVVTLTLKNLDAVFLLNEVFFNFALAGEGKSKIN
jgi:hypothetical protein